MPRIAATPSDALASLRDGEALWCHSMAATPVRLLAGLKERAFSLRELTLMQLHTEGSALLADPALEGHLRQRCFFVAAETRALVQSGRADYVPIFLSELPKLFRRGEQRVDAALIQVSPPDKHGLCTLGVSVEATKAACAVAGRIIAHVNPRMPRSHGDAFIPYDSLHTVYEEAVELPAHAPAVIDPVTGAIGRHVAALITNGACLQMGIGAIPDAVLACLRGHRDLGVHTEMFSDGLLPLVESGVVTGARKKVHPGKLVTSFVLGSRAVYDFVDDNPEVVFLDAEYVNDTSNIRRNPGVVAINSALEVDLTGQICADSMGTRIYSGVGGQMDFMRGAALSEGGKAVIALPSTACGGKVSRIAPMLSLGAGVVTTRAHAQYIVTEYGIANLRGRSLRERAEALIAIAHPDFREELARSARELYHLG
ncbi:MAG: acetyl-CoA hydrolase/transferase family protein [Gammaproteobacteria bacterium]|nr:acetyl-CoA hydrolase/transferase family protein [Gammaproteobacteria bacterium]